MQTRRQFAISAAAAAVTGFGPVSARAADNKIVLGQSAPFTGPAAQLGIKYNEGANLWFEQVNAQGGIQGRLIEIRKLDDGYEPDRCQANTQKFLQEDVFALFGYVGTPTSVSVLPMVNKAQVPFIAPFTGAQSLREPFNKHVIHLRASYHDETNLIVTQLTNLGLNKIAVFYQNDSYGKSGLDGVNQALERLNLKPVATATVERNSVDVQDAVKTLTAAAPDAVVQISAYKSCAAFIRAAKKAGYGGTFYNVSFVGAQALSGELGREGAGVVVSQVVPSPYYSARPIVREFVDAARKAGQAESINFTSMEGYLAAKLVTEGLQRAGGKLPTRESLIQGIETIGVHSFGGYRVQYSPTDHVGSKFVEMSMITAEGKIRT
ncbi:MAG: ABC transporter substrate-binding protein [Hylemonella sp.]|nr:ABC transporter substrate-binding protein [Hylemonella sp.]MDH5707536.1 ABC transporter substrate-binding protein [Hylemonella sp.]